MRIEPMQNLAIAFEGVWTNRFRSLLTILGIVIGIMTVITVSSLLTGLQNSIVVFFKEFGPDNIFINRFSGDPNSEGQPKERKRRPLQASYADFILRSSPSVEDVALTMFVPGVIGGKPVMAKVMGFESEIGIIGRSANIYELSPRELRDGRTFSAEEVQKAQRVCVLGASIAEALFPDGKAVGREITIDGGEFRVLGVFEKAKGGFFGENGLDKAVDIPFSTVRLRYPQLDRVSLTAKARSGKREEAFEEVTAAMRKIRRVPEGVDNDFDVSTSDQIIKQFKSITGVIVLVSAAISGLGLLVGGIGVMNIMLVSVTERTREIGIRKALGARRFDIVFQFLVEAVALTFTGGFLGVLLSIAITALLKVVAPSLPAEIPLWAILTGLGVSIFTGIFFGVWPAVRAARLDPVEALRYE
jgi:putative ABC transport system permease protein